MMLRVFSTIYIIFPLLFLFNVSQAQDTIFRAKSGVIDLTNWNTESNESIDLHGEWEFFWRKFIIPTDSTTQADLLLEMPTSWNKVRLNNALLPSFGYGSYRLRLLLPSSVKHIKLYIPRLHAAGVVYINGQQYLEIGKIGTSAKEEIPGIIEIADRISNNIVVPKNRIVDVVIHVSNFRTKGTYPGISKTIYVGQTQSILAQNIKHLIVDSIILGVLLIIGIYHLFLFFYRRNKPSALVFALLSFIFALRAAYTSGLLYELPLMNYTLGWKLGYLTLPIYPAAMQWFFLFVFPNRTSLKVVYTFSAVTTVAVSIILFSNIAFLNQANTFFGVTILLSHLYLIYISLQAALQKEQGSTLALAGMVIFLVSTLNDFLFATNVIHTTFTSKYGMTLFIIFQAVNLAQHFSLAYIKSEKLAAKLDFKNAHLEEIVTKRTIKVQEQKASIMERNEELRQVNEEISAQRDEIEERNTEIEEKNSTLNTINNDLVLQRDLLDFQNKQINSSIRYARTIQHAILPTNEALREMYPEHFLLYRPKDIVSGDFYWKMQLPAYKELTAKEFIAVVDCTGHGVPGAFMSLIGSRIMNEIVLGKHIVDPSEILQTLDANIRSSLQQSTTENRDGMDLILCRIERRENGCCTVKFAGAKRPLIYFDSKTNTIQQVKGSRRSIGGAKYNSISRFDSHTLELQRGDIIYLSSDGYLDQNGPKHKRVGTPLFLDLLDQIKDKNLQEQGDFLNNYLNKHQGNFEQRDDISLLAIRL